MKTRSESLSKRFKHKPPPRLFHYTSPDGLIGIIKSRKIWATNIRYLNDFNELVEASDTASIILSEMIESDDYNDERDLLIEMREKAGTAASRYYVCSFSEDEDSLSQWRAYCPSTGGYALGIPSTQLSAVAQENGWYFVKCIYDEDKAKNIIKEVITSFLEEHRKTAATVQPKNISNLINNIALRFQLYIAQVGGVIKNKAFEQEQEWRLISPAVVESDKHINFRTGRSGVVPYFEFPLLEGKNPNLTGFKDSTLKLMVGPNPQPNAEALLAAQYLLTRYLDISSGIEHSKVPYRSW